MANELSALAPSSLNVTGLLLGFVAVVIAVVLGIIIFFVYRKYMDNKRYNSKVLIYYIPKGSKNPILKYDVGGVFFKKKSNLKRFWLKGHKIGLDPDDIPFTFDSASSRVITLWQEGLSIFKYVTISGTSNPGLVFAPGEEDVNWAIGAYREFKNFMPDKQSFLQKYGWAMLWILTIVSILILMIMLFQKFEILGGVANSLNNAANSVNEAARQMAEANAAPVIP